MVLDQIVHSFNTDSRLIPNSGRLLIMYGSSLPHRSSFDWVVSGSTEEHVTAVERHARKRKHKYKYSVRKKISYLTHLPSSSQT